MNRFLLLAFVVFAFLPAFAQDTTAPAPALASIEQYLNVKSAAAPTFSPDGKRIAYLTNVTGTSQVWMIDLPAGEPQQITNYDDNVSFVRWLPDGKGLLFGKAIGGNENTQFFLVPTDGTAIRELTNAPTVRHNFGDISDDATKIYYASNKRNRNFFDIYSMNLADAKEELIYQNDGNNAFEAADASGSKFVISRDGIELSLDNNLYLIDAKTKQETLLTPHVGSSQFGSVHFLPDGKSLVLSMNDKREFLALPIFACETARIRATGAMPTVRCVSSTRPHGTSRLSTCCQTAAMSRIR